MSIDFVDDACRLKVMRMKRQTSGKPRNLWSRIFILVGSIAMVIGAVDPMEGSLVILPGSGLVALGTFLGPVDRRLLAYRLGVFVLIAFGVGALWGLSSIGGFGGNSGRSMWWGLLILPYLIGWSIGIWGPGSPRWLLVLGTIVSLWYVVVAVIVLGRTPANLSPAPGIVLGCIGVLTIVGCINQLLKSLQRT